MNYHHDLLDIFYKFKNLHLAIILPDNITHGECLALLKIKEGEKQNITFSTLASIMRVSIPALSKTIRHLEEKGYVSRLEDKLDRRNNFLKLTKSGNNLVKKVKKNLDCYSKNIYKHFGEKRFNEFINSLNDLYDISFKEINK